MSDEKQEKFLTEGEVREILNEEIRAVVHAIRGEVQSIRSLVELQVVRVDRCEQLISDHVKACAENRQSMNEIKEMLATVKTGMKITNALRNLVVWLAGIGVAVSEFWKIFHP